MPQLQKSVERERVRESQESSKALKSHFDIFRVILSSRCFLLTHEGMSVGEG